MDSAADAAKAILNGRGISRVVVVDDDVPQPSWYGLVELLDSEDRAEIGHEVGFDLISPSWREQLDLMPSEMCRSIGEKVHSRAADQDIPFPEGGAEDPALVALRDVLKSHQPQQLTPRQWQARAEELLKRATAEPTLFLIDQRLGPGREGGALLREVIPQEPSGCFFCILTADTSIENEFQYWQELCNKYSFEPGHVGIVAKGHLTGDQIGFARMLKISLTAREVQGVRARVLDVAREGLETGLERFSQLDLPTLTSIAFESSRVEGIWEVETILRVVKAFVEDELDNRVFGDQEVADAVQEISAAASVSTGTDARLNEFSFEIQHAERYATSDYLSTRQVALANGDLFKVTDTSNSHSLWVLVAQACDLVIRSSGRRNGSPTHLTVLPVVRSEEEPKGAHVELLHYFQPGSGRAFVRLTAPAYVPTSILDLAAFSATGEAVWIRGAEMDTMRAVGWQKRARRVAAEFGAALRDHEDLIDLEDEKRRRIVELGLPAAHKPQIRPTVGEDNVRYPIRRVGRLRERQAEAVLQAFGLAISRTAEVHDLARISP